MQLSIFSFFSLLLLAFPAYADLYVLPDKGNEVGEKQAVQSFPGELLTDVAIRYRMGYNELRWANPQIDTQNIIPAYSRILLPTRYTLPNTPRKGIVINLANYRLYYFPDEGNTVMTFPVGIGRDGWNTPTGKTKIIAKEKSPSWRPTENIKQYAAKQEVLMPDLLPPGPGNPLGDYVLRLNWPTYLIHGTNHPEGVGRKVSAGCIRMYPEDIEILFDYVTVGTPVTIINLRQ
ncbi:L,D-transpeptidase [Legionella impletisoli]|uniref:L,D-transpeptidase n=1 Tax=Legionella impletisoli TaxID=343510 RepID=A0A917JPL5_9GAMM|nr:L,D-transpeptidase family protein [Legionella impletisoli]GGI77183.1 L,D-transpeptidase [Legionella impletisoli]